MVKQAITSVTVCLAIALCVAIFQPTAFGKDISFSEVEFGASAKFSTHTEGKVSADSVFQIGSISKFACTLAIMDMQRQGLLNLDSTMNELLPGYAGKAGDRVRLIHLLQNRSGLEDDVMSAFRSDQTLALASISSLEAANRFAASAAIFEPGSQFDYIIANWILVQAILESIDGATIAEVLKARVFSSAGMEKTGVFAGILKGENVASPINPARPVPDFLTCAGGVASTVTDLVKLVRYPYRAEAFGPDELALLTTIATADEGYALGGRYREAVSGGKKHFLSWQSGSNGAYKSIAVYDPLLDVGYAIATADDARKAIEERRRAWMGRTYKD